MTIRNILVCGAGKMGRNIAFLFAGNAEYRVILYDMFGSEVQEGIRTDTKPLVENGLLKEADIEERIRRIGVARDIDHQRFQKADIVIEAVFGDLEMKRRFFANIEPLCSPDAILCTSSWVRSPDEGSEEMVYRERFVGIHFRNPGKLIQLVEVVKCDATSTETIQTVMNVLTGLRAIAAINLGGNC